jgi:DNA-binding GntR family transcriptional regulator
MSGTASHGVYDALFDRIVGGDVAAGARLKEIALSEEFGISRTPVRDALRQLANDGLIKIVPAQGARVVGFSADDVEDVYDIRMALELLALDLAGKALRLQPLAELRDRLQKATSVKNIDAQIDIDALLHRHLVASTNRRYLLHVYDDMGRLMERFRYLGFRDDTVLKRATSEHTDLIEALLVRDIDRARYVLEAHIRNSKLSALAQLHQD